MKSKNILLILAGGIDLFTFFLHAIGGQMTLINPMLNSQLDDQVKTELLGAWHMVTIILLATAVVFLYHGFKNKRNHEFLAFISYIFVLFGVSFVLVSIYKGVFAPQWTLLIPIGILGLVGNNKFKSHA